MCGGWLGRMGCAWMGYMVALVVRKGGKKLWREGENVIDASM